MQSSCGSDAPADLLFSLGPLELVLKSLGYIALRFPPMFYNCPLRSHIMPFISAGDHCGEEISVQENFDHDITGSLHIVEIASGVETNCGPRKMSTHATAKPAPVELKNDVDPVMPGKASRPEIPPAPKRERIPFKQLFLPKFRLCRILLTVDPAAAWIISLSVVANGLMKTWSLACQYKAMTAFQEAILTKNLESATVVPILIQQFIVEFGLQMAIYAGLYCHKRYKKKMEKHLTEILLEGYGALPYAIRIDRYIQKRYNAVYSFDVVLIAGHHCSGASSSWITQLCHNYSILH